jgi:hypothetical protein
MFVGTMPNVRVLLTNSPRVLVQMFVDWAERSSIA